jgi:hypothetical protein
MVRATALLPVVIFFLVSADLTFVFAVPVVLIFAVQCSPSTICACSESSHAAWPRSSTLLYDTNIPSFAPSDCVLLLPLVEPHPTTGPTACAGVSTCDISLPIWGSAGKISATISRRVSPASLWLAGTQRR